MLCISCFRQRINQGWFICFSFGLLYIMLSQRVDLKPNRKRAIRQQTFRKFRNTFLSSMRLMAIGWSSLSVRLRLYLCTFFSAQQDGICDCSCSVLRVCVCGNIFVCIWVRVHSFWVLCMYMCGVCLYVCTHIYAYIICAYVLHKRQIFWRGTSDGELVQDACWSECGKHAQTRSRQLTTHQQIWRSASFSQK